MKIKGQRTNNGEFQGFFDVDALHTENSYANKSYLLSADWLELSGGSGSSVGGLISDQNLETAVINMPDVVSIVFEVNSTYWSAGGYCRFRTRTKNYSYTDFAVPVQNKTVEANGKNYGVASWAKADFLSAYQLYTQDIETNEKIGMGFTLYCGNAGSRFTGAPLKVSGEVDAELIASNFSRFFVSADFVSAVKIAEQSGSDEEERAREKLSGKVWIALGDSYTYALKGLFSSIGDKYGLAVDNRGVVSSSICGTWSAATGTGSGYQPMWRRADAIVSDYNNGFTIGEKTYTKEDVAIITFMGGANDGFGIETWIGTGIHETDTSKIYGACNHIFNVLLENFPNAKVICVAQPSNYNRTVSTISDDATAQVLGFDSLAQLQVMSDVQFSNYAMANKERAVKETAKTYGLYFVDMFSDFPTIFNPANRAAYWASDKLHLSSDGYSVIANEVEKKIVEVSVQT